MTKTKNEKEEFIRVGTTLYKLVNQPRLNGGYVRKRIVWNNRTTARTISPPCRSMTVSVQSQTMWIIVPWWTSFSTSMSR